MKIAFTGHRPNKLGGYDDNQNFKKHFDKFMNRMLYHTFCVELREKTLSFITGMALGVDTWAAKCAIHYNIPFYAYVPFKGQESIWPKRSQEEYNYLLSKAFEVKYLFEPGYAAWKMLNRNKQMVDDCEVLIAIWDGSNGGTSHCVKYAKSVGRNILILDPSETLKAIKKEKINGNR